LRNQKQGTYKYQKCKKIIHSILIVLIFLKRYKGNQK
jgi:hypothetical protein